MSLFPHRVHADVEAVRAAFRCHKFMCKFACYCQGLVGFTLHWGKRREEKRREEKRREEKRREEERRGEERRGEERREERREKREERKEKREERKEKRREEKRIEEKRRAVSPSQAVTVFGQHGK
ncbi:hypothetical protein GRJ2_001573000 [Grus japonensis]|uniref:Uncharacterized protein n=1 Tax=Grus japonensis TaxID=30415 RepID=A0ABC9X2F2_GRUJA